MDDSSPQFDIHALLGVVQRQFRMIAGVFIAVVAISAFVVFSLKPIYSASALVLVDTSQKNILDPNSVDPDSITASARVDSEVELAKSPTVLLRVVKDTKLFQDPAFAIGPGLVSRLLSFLKLREYTEPTGAELLNLQLSKLSDAVSVQRRGLTFIIVIQAQSESPDEAAKVANAVANAYIAEQLEAKVNSTLASRDIIQARIQSASSAVAASEDAIDQFISQNIGAIAAETGRADLETLYNDVSSASAARQELIATLDKASAGLEQKDWQTLTQSLQSDAIKQFEAQREQLTASLVDAGPGTQASLDLRAQLKKVEDQLEAAAQSQIGTLQSQVTTAQGNLSDLKSKLRSNVLSSNLSSSTLTKIYGLQQTSEIARNQYQTLLTRLNDLDQQSFLQVADSRVVSEALAPNAPSFPNPKLVLTVAGMAGLAIGLGLAFLYENFIGGVVSPDQLQALVGSRRAIAVPRQREQKGMLSFADTMNRLPLSVFAEAIRRIRLAIDQTIGPGSDEREGKGRVIVVTSAAPSEGKTTISLSLARAYAQSGLTTLLIDGDLRKPSLHKHLGWEPATGLIDYLNGENDPGLSSIVRVDENSGVGVLVGSRRGSGATDTLVAGSRFGRLVAAASQAFDIVILDTPPVEPVVDGVYLAQFADAVAFVVKWASTPQPEVRRAVGAISDGILPNIEIIMVLNEYDAARRRKGAQKYGYYFSEK
jgi:capsular exopolysaccharide synthesis family protein